MSVEDVKKLLENLASDANASKPGGQQRRRRVSVARRDFERHANMINRLTNVASLSEEQMAIAIAGACLTFGKLSRQQEVKNENTGELITYGFV